MRTIFTPTVDGGRTAVPTRWAAAPTGLMALANTPVFFQPDSNPDLARWFLAVMTVVGVVGLVTAGALLARTRWAAPLALALGAINAIAGVVVLLGGQGNGVVGVVLGLLGVALTLVPARGTSAAPAPARAV